MSITDEMIAKYEKANTDDERLAVLTQYMSHDSALDFLESIERGTSGLHGPGTPEPASAERPFKRPSPSERKNQTDQVAQFIKDGHLRPVSTPDGRPDEGSETNDPEDPGQPD